MPTLRLAPIRYVRDLRESARFYEILGLAGGDPDAADWRELSGLDAGLGLHRAGSEIDTGGPAGVGLQFTTSGPLDSLHAAFAAAGFVPSPIEVADFGTTFTVTDPDGYPVRVNGED